MITYPVAQGKLFNVAVSAPQSVTPVNGKWTEEGNVAEFKTLMSDFSPLVQRIIGHIDRCAAWTLAEVPPLGTWTSGKAVLVGDAAHALSPLAGQGAAMSIEDAAVLGECLDKFREPVALSTVLKNFEALRRPRAERVAELARGNAVVTTLPDGEEQKMRDQRWHEASQRSRSARTAGDDKLQEKVKIKPDMNQQWGHPSLMMWLYGFDAIEDAKSSGNHNV